MYLSLNGTIIPNHGYVVISDIGSAGDDTALLCYTNRPPPTGSRSSGGDWFAPDGTVVTLFGDDVPGLKRNRGPMVVRLYRNPATGPLEEGIYYCQIQDDAGTLHTADVGLYHNGKGWLEWEAIESSIQSCMHAVSGYTTISDGVILNVVSALNGTSPQFTLTCISTGGPATTVIWTRDNDTLTNGTETVLDNSTNAQYTHTLTVSGRLPGLYTCAVALSSDSANITIQGMQLYSFSFGITYRFPTSYLTS